VSSCAQKERCRRIERVADRLFEGEEAVLHVMGWVGGRVELPMSVTAFYSFGQLY
jgi:hypothetical protein